MRNAPRRWRRTMPRSSSSVCSVVRERRERAVGHGRTVAPRSRRLSAKCPLPEGSLVREPIGAIADDDGDVRIGRSSTREGTTMNTSTKLVGAGIALIIGSALAPVAASAAPPHPVRVCLDNASASQCDSVVIASSDESGAGGQEVAVRPPSSGRIDPRTTRTTARSPSNGAATPRTTPTTARSPSRGAQTPRTTPTTAKRHPCDESRCPTR